MQLASARNVFTPFVVAGFGLACGMAWTILASELSPLKSVAVLIGLAATLAVLLNPALGFFLVALVIPMERLGRFTADSSMYTVSLMRMVGLLALGSFLLHAMVRRWQLRVGLELVLYAAYFGLALLGISYTGDVLGTVRGSGAILGNLLFFFLAINLVREWRLARAALALWLVATSVIGLYVIHDWHWGSEVVGSEEGIGETGSRLSTVWTDTSEWEALDQVKRAMGTTSHAAVYGINLILTLPFFLFFLRTTPDRRLKGLALGGLVVSLYNVTLTNTRAAILLAVLVVALAVARGLLKIRPSWILGGAIAAALMLPLVPEAIYQRVFDPSNYSLERSGTLRIRMEYWQAGLSVISENWLTGVGVGNQTEIPKHIQGYGPKLTTVHNEYLQTFIEVGVLGWLVFFGFVGSILRRSFQLGSWLRESGGEMYWFAVAAQIALVSVLIYGIQVDVFHFPLKGWWLVAGLIWAMHETLRRELRREEVLP